MFNAETTSLTVTVLLLTFPSFVIAAVWRFLGNHAQAYLFKKYTVVHELANVGKERVDQERIRGTAVVCGGRCVCL